MWYYYEYATKKYDETDPMREILNQFKNIIYDKYGYEIFNISFGYEYFGIKTPNRPCCLEIFLKTTKDFEKLKKDINWDEKYTLSKLEEGNVFENEFREIVKEFSIQQCVMESFKTYVYDFEFVAKSYAIHRANLLIKHKLKATFAECIDDLSIHSYYHYATGKWLFFLNFRKKFYFDVAKRNNVFPKMKKLAYAQIKEFDEYDYYTEDDFEFAVDYGRIVYRDYELQPENIEHMTFI